MHAGSAGGTPPDGARRRRSSITISFQARDHLASRDVDAGLLAGAQNVVANALGVREGHRFVLVADPFLESIAAALLQSVEGLGADVDAYLVDPQTAGNGAFTARVVENLRSSDASVLVAPARALPDDFLGRVTEAGGQRRRHADMVGVTEPVVRQSLRADFEELLAFGDRVKVRLSGCHTLRIRSPVGTDLMCTFQVSQTWLNDGGRLTAPGTTYLPAGSVSTTPLRVQGVLVADGGAWLPDGKELGRRQRLVFRFDESEVVAVEGANASDVLALLDQEPERKRVSRLGLGTNASILTPIGVLPQDITMPGFHLVLGPPRPLVGGTPPSFPSDIPLLVRRPDVQADGTPLLVRGKYAKDI